VSQIAARQTVTLDRIAGAIRSAPLPDADRVVGIGSGGIVPATLIAFHLDLPLSILWLNYRDRQNRPRYADPKLIAQWAPPSNGGTLLLVDDVSVSGKTLATARKLLEDSHITTVVMKGRADYVMLPGIETCVNWPWSEPTQ